MLVVDPRLQTKARKHKKIPPWSTIPLNVTSISKQDLQVKRRYVLEKCSDVETTPYKMPKKDDDHSDERQNSRCVVIVESKVMQQTHSVEALFNLKIDQATD